MTPDPSGFFNILEKTLSSQPGRIAVLTFSLPDLFNSSGNDCNSTIVTTRKAFSQWLLLLTMLRFVFFSPVVVDLSSWLIRRLTPWFRANMTAWLYENAKKHMSKHSWVYSTYRQDIRSGDFKRAFLTHRSDCRDCRSEKDVQNKWVWQKIKRRNNEGRPGEKRDVVPPQQLLQKQGN